MPLIAIPLYAAYHFHKLWILGTVGVVILLVLLVATVVKSNFLDYVDSVLGWFIPKPTAMTSEEIDLLVCGKNKATKLSELPSHKKTLKLRFHDLKSKVCRPFSA